MKKRGQFSESNPHCSWYLFEVGSIALLSHERSECKPERAQPSGKLGSGIAKRIPRGVVPLGTTATPGGSSKESFARVLHHRPEQSNQIPCRPDKQERYGF